MCDVATESQIHDVVKALVKQRRMFSAYDISQAVRKLGFKEYHRDMKKIVHRMFDGGEMDDFGRTLVKYPSAPTRAFRYHPPELDPNDFGTVQTPILAAPAAAFDADNGSSAASGPDLAVVKTPGTCLYVPRSMAKTVGIPPSGNAYMDIDPAGKISITTLLSNGSKKTHVDRNQNIRIGRTALLKAGIKGKVRIELDGNEIKLSKG